MCATKMSNLSLYQSTRCVPSSSPLEAFYVSSASGVKTPNTKQ